MAVEHSRFASELNKLLEAAPLSPEEVTVELNKQGFPVPQHTFSYWLQGYFLPRSESAFQLVAVLESIFSVSDNRLADALLEDLSSGASFVPGENSQAEVASSPVEHERFSSSADVSVDWESIVVQKVVRDEIYLEADRKYLRHKVTILARVPSAPNPTFLFHLSLERDREFPGKEDVFYDLSGVTLKKCEIVEENGRIIYVAQFALPDDVVPGDLYQFSYTWDEKSNVEFDIPWYRFVPWSLDFYSCRVTFEGEVPQGIRYVTCEKRGIEDVEVPNNILIMRDGKTVSISAKNFGNITGYFEIPASAV